MTDARTIVFFPEGAYGPTNNCVGIGSVLRARGHRVVFVVEESFAGTLEAKGFEERLMRLGPPPEVPGDPRAVLDRLHPRHRRRSSASPRSSSSASSSRRRSRRSSMARSTSTRGFAEIFDELGPDVIVEDNVVAFPALAASGPAVGPHRVVQPGRDEGSGRSRRSRPATRPRIVAAGRPSSTRSAGPTATCGRTSMRSAANTASTASRTGRSGPDFIAESPYLNLYSYPAEADYDARARARTDVAPPRLHGPRGRLRPGSCRSTFASGMGR